MIRFRVFLIFALVFFTPISAWSDNIFSPKVARVHWGTNTFAPIEHYQLTFKENNPAVGFEYLHIFDSNIAVGGEFLLHKSDLISASYDPHPSYGHANVYQLLAEAGYFFPLNENIKAFVGVGFGPSEIGINTERYATLNGYTYMANSGIQFKYTRRIGFTLGYKLSYLYAEDRHNVLKTNMQEISLSLNIYGGR